MLNGIDLSRADLNLLVLFEVVMRERHVGRAAEALSLSASAVSHGLGRLRRLLKDPLFLRTPKGVVPTARAQELAEPIADILARIRRVVATAESFDPATAARRFIIGAPDGASAVLLRGLLDMLGRTAPGIDLGLRQLLPNVRGRASERPWDSSLAELESREIDLAVLPLDEVPARFAAHPLYEEEFVVACRAGHAYAERPNLDHFCAMRHLVVSQTGDPHGLVDIALAEQGRTRRVALTAPNFMMALAVVAETDLIAALPRRLVAAQAARFGIVAAALPVPLARSSLRAIALRPALMDEGIAWLFGAVCACAPGPA
ncbi:LysR family transcriptional regulator [Arenibaculum pallidiluteum]|uniref:LysR family transcriptional regulator n=1 Tax=Arenibaculum pallidiluteum TaxID=2812559 RepID=UPI001A973712|nr:LysR family transcriptional regulator [Arenibaculum pallidiluteum]